jgi:hypothetical protein
MIKMITIFKNLFKSKKQQVNKLSTNSFVVFNENSCSLHLYEQYYKETFPLKKLFVYLGEIKQAKGHCILADLETGKIIGMYHTYNFREATEDEC